MALAGAAFALLGLLALPSPASAQTTITLVSNTGQADGDTGGLGSNDHAQAFTTGGHAAGYKLTGVDIEFASVAAFATAYAVSIWTDSSGSPGTSVGTLTRPASLTHTALNSYTSSSGIDLAASTTYFVIVDSSSGERNSLQNTASDSEDTGGQSGFSIANGSVYRTRTATTGAWTAYTQSKKIAIKGYAKTATDTTAPAFASAAANGTSLVITFDEDLAAAASLANSAFTVKKTPSGGVEATVTLSATAPVISGTTVTLTLATALVSTDTAVKVTYTQPTTGSNNKLVDAASNATATFTDQTVTNNTPASDTTAPTVTSIARQIPTSSPTNANSLTWRVTFSEVVSNVDAADFSVAGTTATLAVSAVTGVTGAYDVTASGGTLASLNATVTLSFAATQNIQDAASNALTTTTPTGTNNNTYVVDNAAPTLSRAAVNESSGTQINLMFSESLDFPTTTEAELETFLATLKSAFAVTAAGTSVSIVQAVAGGPPFPQMNLIISPAIKQGSTVVLSYTDPTAGDDAVAVEDAAGNETPSFTTGMNSVPAVTNFSTVAAVVPGAPTGLGATANGTTRIDLSWTAPADNGGRVITGYKIEWSAAGSAPWTVLIATTDSTATTYSHTGLAAGTTRHYRVSAINAIGTGAASNVDSATTTSAQDTTAPAFESAAANGTSLVITFDEDLAAAASLATSAFTVKKTPSGGVEAAVALSTTIAPVISGKTVTLILATALVSTDTAVKVSYTQPATGTNNKLVDAASNATATFTDQPVTNNTGASDTPRLVFSLLEESDRTLLENGDENEHSLLVLRSDGPVDEEQRVTLTFGGTATKGEDYRTGSTLSISVGGISVGRNLTPLDDDLVEGDETIEITAWHDGRDIGTETITIIDDESMDATPPTVANAIPDQTATAGTAFSYAFPANTFSDADSDTLSYTATKADGTALPTWLSFTASTRAFSGTPQAADTGTVSVKVTASDGNGGSVSDEFDITVSAVADTTAPVFESAAANGASLVITFDEALDGASILAPGDFAVTADGSTVTVTGVGVAGSAVTLTLATAVEANQAVTLAYAPGTNPIQNAAGNGAVLLSGQTVTNNTGRADVTPPTLTGATVNGSTLTLTYDEALDRASVPAASDFAVTAAGSTVTVTGVGVAGSTVTLTLATAVEANQAVALDYTLGANPTQDAAGNDAVLLSGQTVTNNTGRADVTPPALTGATVSGSTLVLTYNAALDGASVPAAGNFVVTAAGSTVTVTGVGVAGSTVTLTLAAAVQAGQTVALNYTPGTNPTQDVAGNDAAPLSGQLVTNNTGGGGGGGGGGTDPPLAVDDAAQTAEDTPVTIAVLTNDSDPNGDTLTVVEVSAPAHGTAVVADAGEVVYTPEPDFNGSDRFTYIVGDGSGLTAQAAVEVTVLPVNDPPLAVDDAAETAEDAPVIIAVLANDSDADGDTLAVVEVSAPAHGAARLTDAGAVEYTPALDFHGPDRFTYVMGDGSGLTAQAAVAVTVLPVNDPPRAVDDAAETAEDTPVTIAVLANDSDADGDTLAVVEVSAPAHGAARLTDAGAVEYTPALDFHGPDRFTYVMGDGSGLTAQAAVAVTVLPVNDPPRAVEYTPALDFHGPDRFTYVMGDGSGLTAQAAVAVTVLPVNDPPRAVNDAAETAEDTPVTIAVLTNDSDADGDPLALVETSAPAHGSARLTDAGAVVYTPEPDYHGSDRFTYVVGDGSGQTAQAAVAVTVLPVNDPPQALGVIPDQTLEAGDGPASLDLSPFFEDRDGDDLGYAAVASEPAVALSLAGATLTLTVARPGAATVTVTAQDPGGLTATQAFLVTTTDRQARGVVEDTLAALGRGHLASARATLGRRVETTGQEESRVTVAGLHVPLGTGAGGLAAAGQAVAQRWITGLAGGMPLQPGGWTGTGAGMAPGAFGAAGAFAAPAGALGIVGGGPFGAAGPAQYGTGASPALSGFSPLGGGQTDFVLALGSGQAGGGAAQGQRWTVWGQSDLQSFGGEQSPAARYDGDLRTAYVGVDARLGEHWLAGVAVSRSRGDGDWNFGSSTGRLTTRLTSVQPYLRWSDGGTTIWATAGGGSGAAENERLLYGLQEESDLGLRLGLVEVRRRLATVGPGVELQLRGDASWARLTTAAGDELIDALEVDVRQLRVGIDVSRPVRTAGGTLVEPFGEVHARHDGGSGQTGAGLEVAGGLRVARGVFRVEGMGRLLALHAADGYREHGAAVTLSVGDGARQPGLTLSLSPRWGAPATASDALWQDQLFHQRAAGAPGVRRDERAFDTRVDYGLQLPAGGLLTPFGIYGQSQYGRRLQVGLLLSRLGPLGLEVSGERYALVHPGRDEYRMSVLGSITFGGADNASANLSAVQ